jgi:hypothetical protein
MTMKREFRHWEKWECFQAGFYAATGPAGKTHEDCERAYADILGNVEWFRRAAFRVMNEWPESCAHFLSNEGLNRVAWLGQASVCIETGVPSRYKYSFLLMTQEKQEVANNVARRAIRWWEDNRRKRPALFENVDGQGLSGRDS